MSDMIARALANRTAKLSNGDGYNVLEGLRNWRNAIADIDSNPAKIMILGDSIAYGMHASNIMLTNWVNRMRVALSKQLGDQGLGWIPLPTGNPQGGADQPQWTLTGAGWTVSYSNGSPTYGVSARFLMATGAANSASFQFTGTAFDLVYAQGTQGASSGVAMTVDGVAVTPPNFNSATDGNFGKVKSYTGFSAGTHTVQITAPASGYVYVEGAMTFNPPASGAKGVQIYNFAEPSATTKWFPQSLCLSVAQPHLSIIALGMNDANNTGLAAAYMQNMGNIITACQAQNSSVLLVAYFDVNDSRKSAWQSLIPQLYQLADKYNVALVDIYTRWGKSYNLAQIAGLMGASPYVGSAGSDTVHPSDKGHRDIASAIARHLIGGMA